MKLLLFVAVIACLSSCTTNNDNPITVSEADVVGLWNVTDFTSEGTTVTTAAGITINSSFVSTGTDYNFTYNFQTDPNEVTASGFYTSINVITVDGVSTTTEIPVTTIDGLNNGTWSINGNIITIVSVTGQEEQAIIEEITDNLMVLRVSYSLTQSLPDLSISVTGSVLARLER